MSYWKTSRCRYFDDYGKPITPYCLLGARCRFAHPGDSHWNARSRAGSRQSSDYKTELKSRKTRKRDTSHPRGRQSSVLALREDIYDGRRGHDHHSDEVDFKAHTREGSSRTYAYGEVRNRDEDTRRDGGSGLGGSRDKDKPSPAQITTGKEKEVLGPLKTRTPESYGEEKLPNHNQAIYSKEKAHSSSVIVQNNAHISHQTEHNGAQDNHISGLLRHLARMSNQTLQNITAYEREEARMIALAELSTELSKVTSTASRTVAPAMSSVASSQATYKERMDRDLQELERIWDDMLALFMKRVTQHLDSGLRNALEAFTRERETLSQIFNTKRKASEAAADEAIGTGKESACVCGWPDSADTGVCESPRQRKRPRLTADSPLPARPKQESLHNDHSIKDILEDMRSKMDKQTNTLEMLARENGQLKLALQGRSDLFTVPLRPASTSEDFSAALTVNGASDGMPQIW